MSITASFPMIKLWDSILKNDENLNAEQVVNLVRQSLCAVGSAFQSSTPICRKCFQGYLTTEFRSLVGKQPNKSEPALSSWLFGSNLEEQIKSKLDSSTFSWKVISREIPCFRIEIFPTPGVGEEAEGDHFFLRISTKGVVSRKEVSLHTPRLCQAQEMSNRSRYFISKDLSIFMSLGTDNKRPRDFKEYRRLFNKISTNSIQMRPPPPLRNLSEGEVAAIDKEDCRSVTERCYRGLFAYPRRLCLKHFHDPKEERQKHVCNRCESINEFVEYIPFRMEDISLLKSVLKQGDFINKPNLRVAYLTVLLDKKSKIYLHFVWRDVLYQFTCLPFGLSSSGRIFTKAMKPVIAFLRAMGIRLLIFLDDGKLSRACNATHRLRNPGLNLLVVCDRLPKVHSHSFKGVALPGLRAKLRSDETFLAKRKAFKSKTVCSRNHVPSSHCKPCIKFSQSLSVDHACNSRNPPSHQGNTEGSHKGHSLGTHASYKIKVTLSQEAINYLQWWIDSVHLNNGRDIIPPPVDTMIFCDASEIGWGAHLDSVLIGGRWLKEETNSHINFLDLKAAFLAFQTLVPSVKRPHICFGIDNRTAVSHINKLGGTQSQTLSNLAEELWNYALNRNLIISAIHIPGKLNVKNFDCKSRIFKDSIEWMLNPSIFGGVVARLA